MHESTSQFLFFLPDTMMMSLAMANENQNSDIQRCVGRLHEWVRVVYIGRRAIGRSEILVLRHTRRMRVRDLLCCTKEMFDWLIHGLSHYRRRGMNSSHNFFGQLNTYFVDTISSLNVFCKMRTRLPKLRSLLNQSTILHLH